jgi:hypothetical protein
LEYSKTLECDAIPVSKVTSAARIALYLSFHKPDEPEPNTKSYPPNFAEVAETILVWI